MKRINLMIGSSCNWKCPYCIQQDENSVLNKKPNIDLFCQKFFEYINKHNITIKRIAYWGGEPLLYWKYIEAIEQQLVDKLPIQLPSRIITNGSLVTKDHVRYFNKRNQLINISYHQGQLSEDQWKLCFKIKNLYVTSLVSHQCTNWEPYRKKWYDMWKLYGRCINWFVYPIHATPGVPQEWILTKEDIDKYLSYIKDILPYVEQDPFYKRMIQILFYSFSYHEYNPQYLSYCYNDSILSLDLFGNKYFCHHDCNSSNIVGQIFDDKSTNKDVIFLKQLKSNTNECKMCEAYKYCVGGCFRDTTFDTTCYYTKQMYKLLKYIADNHSNFVEEKYSNLFNK